MLRFESSRKRSARTACAGSARTARWRPFDGATWRGASPWRSTVSPGIFGPDGAKWLDTFECELDNFRNALAWSMTDPIASSAQAGLRLAGALRQLWFYGYHLEEGQRWLEQTLLAHRERSDASSQVGAGGDTQHGGTASSVTGARTGAFGGHSRVLALNGLSVLLLTRGRRSRLRAQPRWRSPVPEMSGIASARHTL